MKWKLEQVLLLSAHTDDMELGAGATVRLMIDAGIDVKSIVFSDCKRSVDTSRYETDILRKECEAAAKDLGIKNLTIHEFPVREFPRHRQEILEIIYGEKREGKYDLVLGPWTGDIHQDHHVVAQEAIRGFMKTKAAVLAYEIPGNCPGFHPQIYVPISAEDVERKIDTLHKYQSQVVRRGYFEVDSIKAQMAYHGLSIGCHFAEGFVLERGSVRSFGT